MTVSELVIALTGYPDDSVVVLSSDAVGNRYNQIDGVGIMTFAKDKNADSGEGHGVSDKDMSSESEPLERVVGIWPLP